MFFGDWPDFISWIGIAMIFSAGMCALAQINNGEAKM